MAARKVDNQNHSGSDSLDIDGEVNAQRVFEEDHNHAVTDAWWEGQGGLHNISSLCEELRLRGWKFKRLMEVVRRPYRFETEWYAFHGKRHQDD